MKSAFWRGAAVALVYVLIALIALYHPVFHLPDHVTAVPDGSVSDYYHFHWNYWWMRHALTHGLNIYETTYVMAPWVNSLALHTLTPFWYPVWALIEPLAGTATAMTAIFVLSLSLAGCAFYALMRTEGTPRGLALAGGAMLELSPLMYIGLYWTNINIMGWFTVPLLLITWRQVTLTAAARRWGQAVCWALMAGAVVWAMVLIDLQFPLFALFLALPYGLRSLWRARPALRPRLIGLAVLSLLCAAALLWVASPVPHVVVYDRAGLAPTPAERAVEIPLECYISHCASGLPVGIALLPLSALALLIGLRRGDRGRYFWLIVALPPLILSAGASLRLGEIEIALPYRLFHDMLGGMFRYPERFAPLFAMPLLIFAARTFAPVVRHPAARWIVPALALWIALADARIFTPVPVGLLPPAYAFYEALAREPYEYVIVDVPTGGMSGEGIVGDPRWMTTQFYGLTHGKRMVNGHISRINSWHYLYMETSDPMMAWLGQRRDLEPETVAAQMAERIPLWPIGYFVLHRNFIRQDGRTLEEIVAFFNAHPELVCPSVVEGDLIAYRTTWHPDGCAPRTASSDDGRSYVIDLGVAADVFALGEGWHTAETVSGVTWRWMGATGDTAVLYADLPPGGYDLSLSAQAFHVPRPLRVSINDMMVGEVSVAADELAEYSFSLPAEALGDGRHVRIALHTDDALSPAEIGQGDDARPLSIAVDAVRLFSD